MGRHHAELDSAATGVSPGTMMSSQGLYSPERIHGPKKHIELVLCYQRQEREESAEEVYRQEDKVDTDHTASTLEELKWYWEISRDQGDECYDTNKEDWPVYTLCMGRPDCEDEACFDPGEDHKQCDQR
jgi:hypothetical protein